MRFIKIYFLSFLLLTQLYGGKDSLNINDMEIMELIRLTSKIVDKNILITQKINGTVNFISNKLIDEDNVINVLIYVLETKGYTLVENNDILRIVKINDTVKQNLPVIYGTKENKYYQMVTEIFHVKNLNVDYISSKVRHLISKSAKLVTDKESNAIVITDFPKNIKTIKEIINFITKDDKKIIENVDLKNIEASIAKTTMDKIAKEIFNFKITAEKVEIIANKENNSITFLGKKENVIYLKKYLENIDKKGNLIKRVVEVFTLKNAEATSVIKIIDSIIGKKKYIDPNLKPYASFDEESNSVVLMGPKDEINYIKELIEKLDKERLQVYVQARIIEVNEGLINKVGAKYGLLGGLSGNNGLLTFASNLNRGEPLVFDPANIGLSIPSISSGFALGASISLLKENFALDIVSEPSLLCVNNKESSIYVGETISIQTGQTTNDTGTTNSYAREDVGLTLKVKPRISDINKVTLEIKTILEGVKETDEGSNNPDTSKKEINTTAIVNNGESVIIGGLIEDKKEKTDTKVPLLGDIPLVGELFKNKSINNNQKNLIVIITPYLIPRSKDLTYVREQLVELKVLEDKFLKEKLIRLERKQKELKNTKDSKKIESKEKTPQQLHQERINKIFGL